MILKESELINIKMFWEKSFNRIQQIDDNNSKNFNKNLLWYTFIESIAVIPFSKLNPGDRFRKALQDLCKWNNCNKVISPLFCIYLENNRADLNLIIDELKEDFWGAVLKNPEASSPRLSADVLPSSDEMITKTKLDQNTVNKFRLDNLLWQVRNMGIHSRWQADYGTLGITDFSIVCDLKSSKKNWRVYIPEPFLRGLVKNAMDNFNTNESVEIESRNDLEDILLKNFLLA